jgi:nanoRNase/pAp phosphatase (c-di-AMP/oligoRNAs hydrolase)
MEKSAGRAGRADGAGGAGVARLAGLAGNSRLLYIQTHDFPDHDAVVSAYALSRLLILQGVETRLIYSGSIQRDSLKRLIAALDIPIRPAAEYALEPEDRIVVIDGLVGNRNVTDLTGREVAVIDHHDVDPHPAAGDLLYRDIRPDCGACATIVYGYFREAGLEPSRDVATALLVGLLVDTAQLTRGVGPADVGAYAALYRLADIPFVNTLLRNSIQKKDLAFYRHALDRVRIRDRFAFCYFEEGCNQNLLGIIGDFFLSLAEVDFVLLCARNRGSVNFSVRSELKRWNAARIIRQILAGDGFGGGHQDMAGGVMPASGRFDEEEFFRRTDRTLGGATPPAAANT